MKKILPFVLLINSLTLASAADNEPPPLVMHYDEPARIWAAEALPVGNGRLGAMVFGGVETERLQLNEESVWAGPPVPELPAGFKDAFQRARELWFEGKHAEAQTLVQEHMSERISPRSHQTLGDLKIVMLGGGNAPVISCPSGQQPFHKNESVAQSVDGDPATKWCVQHGGKPCGLADRSPATSGGAFLLLHRRQRCPATRSPSMDTRGVRRWYELDGPRRAHWTEADEEAPFHQTLPDPGAQAVPALPHPLRAESRMSPIFSSPKSRSKV